MQMEDIDLVLNQAMIPTPAVSLSSMVDLLIGRNATVLHEFSFGIWEWTAANDYQSDTLSQADTVAGGEDGFDFD